MLPIGRATFEAEEFFTACEYDHSCSPDTVSFYRKKVTRFLIWAQRERVETLDAQAVRRFFRWLKDQGPSDNGRHTYLRALRTWFNFMVRRKAIAQSPLADADQQIRAVWRRPIFPSSIRSRYCGTRSTPWESCPARFAFTRIPATSAAMCDGVPAAWNSRRMMECRCGARNRCVSTTGLRSRGQPPRTTQNTSLRMSRTCTAVRGYSAMAPIPSRNRSMSRSSLSSVF